MLKQLETHLAQAFQNAVYDLLVHATINNFQGRDTLCRTILGSCEGDVYDIVGRLAFFISLLLLLFILLLVSYLGLCTGGCSRCARHVHCSKWALSTGRRRRLLRQPPAPALPLEQQRASSHRGGPIGTAAGAADSAHSARVSAAAHGRAAV